MQPWLQLWQCRFIHFWAQKQQVGPNGKNWLASNQISDTSVLYDWVMLAWMPAYKWMNVQLWKGTTYSIHIILWDSVWQKKKKNMYYQRLENNPWVIFCQTLYSQIFIWIWTFHYMRYIELVYCFSLACSYLRVSQSSLTHEWVSRWQEHARGFALIGTDWEMEKDYEVKCH